MKLDAAAYMRLRRLAPVLDDMLSAGEIEHGDQAAALLSIATLCSQLSEAYGNLHRDEPIQGSVDPLEWQ